MTTLTETRGGPSDFAEAITRHLERSIAVPDQIRDLSGAVSELQEMLRRQSVALQEIDDSVGSLRRGVDALYERQECLEHASRQQTLLTEEHYATNVIVPVGRQLFRVIDNVVCAARLRESSKRSTNLFNGFRAELLDALLRIGIEPIEFGEGTPFDPAVMRPVEFTVTHNREKDRTVADVRHLGFRRGDHVLRYQGVVLYRYQSPPVLESTVQFDHEPGRQS